MDLWTAAAVGLLLYVWVTSMRIPTPSVSAPSGGIGALAAAIAAAEGFGLANDIGTANNNPGNLTQYGTGEILSYPTEDAGWLALYTFLSQVAAGTPPYQNVVTIQDFANVYTATQPLDWANNVASGLNELGYGPVTPMSPLAPILQAP